MRVRRRRADADLLVLSVRQLLHARRGVNADRPGEIRGRRNAFVEDADLRRVANAEDVAVDVDGVFELEVADVGFGERSLKGDFGHDVRMMQCGIIETEGNDSSFRIHHRQFPNVTFPSHRSPHSPARRASIAC